ncbi:cation channel sperm-associated auxiliary subunit gamma [Eudromia elegans]
MRWLVAALSLWAALRGAGARCRWRAALSPAPGGPRAAFARQHPEAAVAALFEALTDTAVDTSSTSAPYYGFPYYLEIRLGCRSQGADAERATRSAHLLGLLPLVTVTFEPPVHPVRQKPERLQIQLRAAPFRSGRAEPPRGRANLPPGLDAAGPPDGEELSRLRWYTPLPMVNGSAAMDVRVRSSFPGLGIAERRFSFNVNGFLRETAQGLQCTIGHPVRRGDAVTPAVTPAIPQLKKLLEVASPSRPLWATVDKAPVLILGGFSNNKAVLISDSGFDDFLPVEVDIDSCWIGSLTCPWSEFSSTILDAIATESTLFIRQNQLVYYFTGNYSVLHMATRGSALWTRVLNRVCVGKLNPVPFPHNGSEFVLAIGRGQQEADFFLGTVRDGAVHFSEAIRAHGKSACEYLEFPAPCRIQWAIYMAEENRTLLLLERAEDNATAYHVVACEHEPPGFSVVYDVPRFRPKATEKAFVMLVGLEEYSETPTVLRGLSYNPFSTIFYAWGNVILQSYDSRNYIFLSEFPGGSVIKNFIQSYRGEIVCVTEAEERRRLRSQLWFFMEGSSAIERLYPSRAWSMFAAVQLLEGAEDYGANESTLTTFYTREGLQQLVYIPDGAGRVVKRSFPVAHVLSQRCLHPRHYSSSSAELRFVGFTNVCPFTVLKFSALPAPQRYSRLEHYRAEPPVITDRTGFHDNRSLAVYQGLVFHLLWLHSDYNRPYADPVHDPTWRWWRKRKQDADYYLYLASTGSSPGGIYVNMEHYAKIYDLPSRNELPEHIYLDKGDAYSFSLTLSIRSTSVKSRQGPAWEKNLLNRIKVTVVLSHPSNLVFFLQRRDLVNRASVLYKVQWVPVVPVAGALAELLPPPPPPRPQVRIQDTARYPQQGFSGKNLLKSSMVLKVVNSAADCYQYSEAGPALQGYHMVPVFIGCPPGKRMAFDVANSVRRTTSRNKRYFSCVSGNPELPCFFFEDVFYPLFLIQDMVTGDSGSFTGRYTLKVIGGSAHSEGAIERYRPEDVWKYNVDNASTRLSLIWQSAGEDPPHTDRHGYPVHSSTSNGIRWLCQRDSPCHNVAPTGLTAPGYFFLVLVSNRDVDTSTYCDYNLEFILHVQGLQLSATSKLFFMKVTLSVLTGLAALYCLYCHVGRRMVASFISVLHKLEDVSTLAPGSASTSASSVGSRADYGDELPRSASGHSLLSELRRAARR